MTCSETSDHRRGSRDRRDRFSLSGASRSQAETSPILLRGPASALLLVAWLAFQPVAATTAPERITALSDGDLAGRFEAAMALIHDKRPGVAEALEEALQNPAILGSRGARAALEFVVGKRAGNTLLPLVETGAGGDVEGVVLISIDTLRADHLGCYGYEHATSPIIDSIAARGALFRRAVSPASWTLPAHMSIFTSLYPSFHKLEKGGKVGNLKLDSNERTLPEILKESGFHTAGFVANPFLDASWGFGRGFDFYRRYVTNADAQSRRAALWIEWHRYHAVRNLGPRKFFLFVHYIDPHEPYSAPREFQKKFIREYGGKLAPSDRIVSRFLTKEFETGGDFDYVVGLYDAEIRFVDESLGRIMDSLKLSGVDKNTVIVITSDHGEEFKDHGAMGHKETLYDEQLLVPLVIALPGRIAPGTLVESQVSLLDIAPTIGEATGAGAPGLGQGISLLPYLPGPPGKEVRQLPRRTLFAELGPLGVKWEGRWYRRAARTDELKLILSYTKGGLIGRELYDLKTDPEEKTNIWEARKDDETAKSLERSLVEFIKESVAYNPAFQEHNSITLDEEMIEQLRSLGYIDD